MIGVLDAPPNSLGECPLWCDETQRLWWVDIVAPALWCHDPARGESRRHAVAGRRLGAIALRRAGGLILATEDGLWRFDQATGAQDFLLEPEPGRPKNRKNDGRADPQGGFWISTMQESDGCPPVGALYRVAPDLAVARIAGGLRIPNALAFDAARERVYWTDTPTRQILRAALGEDGSAKGRQVFTTVPAPGQPDGACVDAEGCLWNAEHGAAQVTRYAPDGRVLRRIALPVSNPTCCCFGGPDLDQLYVTTAAAPPGADEPLAGRVLRLLPGVRGLPENRVAF